MKAKNIKNKFLFAVVFSIITLISMTINVKALGYNDGDVINPINSVGSLNNQGDVKLTKTVSKTDNYGEYLVELFAQGKDKKAITSTTAPIYTVVVLDTSGSMQNEVCVDGTPIFCIGGHYEDIKYPKAVEGAKSFANALLGKYSSSQLALVTFSSDVTVKRDFSNQNFDSVSFPSPDGTTNLGAAIKKASEMLAAKKASNENAKLYMVVLSDGYPERQTVDHNKAANEAKNVNGIEIFTIGYDTDERTQKLLEGIATDKNHYSDANGSDIVKNFTDIVGQIEVSVPAGTNAVITDTIKDGFTYVEGSASTSNVTINKNKITFNIGDITEEGKKVSFKIKASDDLLPGTYPTNDVSNNGVNLTYTDFNNHNQTKSIATSSEVFLNPDYSYVIKYYLNSKDNSPFDVVNGKGKYNSVVNLDFSNIPDGYEYTGSLKSFTIDEKNKVVDIVYTKKTYSYVIEYYKDSTDNDMFDSKTGKALFQDEIDVDISNIPSGYVYGGQMSFILENDKQVFKVLYKKNSEISYKINYYKDSVREDNYLGSIEGKATYQDVIVADIYKFLPENYEFIGSAPTLVIDVENNVINVVYTKVSIRYFVNYYFDEELKETKEVVLPYDEEIEFNEEFDGYVLKNIENIGNNNINLYYVSEEIKNVSNETENYVLPPKTGVDYSYLFVIYLLIGLLFIRKKA